MAVELAKALSAVKLVYMTTRDGLVVDGTVARQISVGELARALEAGRVAPDQVSKASHAVAACSAGVPRVHVVNGHVDDGLVAEVFSNEGIGTLVYANEYQQIRRARRGDVRAIEQLIHSSVESEELAPRTRATIERELADYYIFEVDQHPIACVALHEYADRRAGELACLYVHPSHENRGIGRTMVQFVEAQARERGFDTLLALSTQAFNYFLSKVGFREGTPDDLPAERRARYDASGRKSKVLVKSSHAPMNQRATVVLCRMVHGSDWSPPGLLFACSAVFASAQRDAPVPPARDARTRPRWPRPWRLPASTPRGFPRRPRRARPRRHRQPSPPRSWSSLYGGAPGSAEPARSTSAFAKGRGAAVAARDDRRRPAMARAPSPRCSRPAAGCSWTPA